VSTSSSIPLPIAIFPGLLIPAGTGAQPISVLSLNGQQQTDFHKHIKKTSGYMQVYEIDWNNQQHKILNN
jgi:hypothetical protein